MSLKTTKKDNQDKGAALNFFEVVRLRPDTYIGSVVTVLATKWHVYSEAISEGEDNENIKYVDRIISEKIRYNPGLMRLIIEILSNAIDNKWRSEKHGPPMKAIKVTVDKETGWIEIWNDGYCIPVEKEEFTFTDEMTGKKSVRMHYPAEVYFGKSHAGTNLKKDKIAKTSGINGIGAKCCASFSSCLTVDHANPDQKKRFVQSFRYTEDGLQRDAPVVTKYNNKTGYTKISFRPDYEYFNYPSAKAVENGEAGMDDDLFNIIKKHVYDTAMITRLNVTFNEEKLVVKDLTKYVRLFEPDKKRSLFEFVTSAGDQCVLVETGYEGFDPSDGVRHMAFINGIHTSQGGVHVDAWRDEIFSSLVKAFNARKTKKGEKKRKASARDIYPYFTLFIRHEVDRPSFDSQTKDYMNGPEVWLYNSENKKEAKEWREYMDEAMTKILKWSFVKNLEENMAVKLDAVQSKKENATETRLGLGKTAQDANCAGKKNRKIRTILIITEGGSARTMAIRGSSKQPNGPDQFGTLAIKGKFTNVTKASRDAINANKEVRLLRKMLGVKKGIDYSEGENAKLLRYDEIWLMTDSDDDGIHIRGLLINFFYKEYPSLLKVPGFLSALSTPVIKLKYRLGNSKTTQEMVFWSNPSFKTWETQLLNGELEEGSDIRIVKDSINYYKGLGTHSPAEAVSYFNNPTLVKYFLEGDEQTYMDLAFGDKKDSNGVKIEDKRKAWITREMRDTEAPDYDPNAEVIEDGDYVHEGDLGISTFVDRQLIIYSRMSLSRALPNVYDGFKEAHRKIFFGISQKRLKKLEEMEVLGGAIKEITGYHHGEKSLYDTMTGMGMGFVGSNNIPLLVNGGEFGSRLEGGDDASAPRYLKTKLEDVAETLFPALDEPLYKRCKDGKTEIEYEFYVPILPMLLINGSSGMATGFSTNIPCYNPEDLVERIKCWLEDQDNDEVFATFEPLKPWYRGFKGDISLVSAKDDESKYVAWTSRGILKKKELVKGKKKEGASVWWEINEAPIGLWSYELKEEIEYLATGVPPEGTKRKQGEKYLKDFKFNFTANTVQADILPRKDFIPDMDTKGNLTCLVKRSTLTNMVALDEHGYPRRYSCPEDIIKVFCKKRLSTYEKRREYYLKLWGEDLHKTNNRYLFVKSVITIDPKTKKPQLILNQEDDMLFADMEKIGLDKVEDSYEYLLSMQARSFTKKRVDELAKEIEKIEAKIAALEEKTAKEWWLEELADFEKAYAKFLKARDDEGIPLENKKKKAVTKKNKKV